MTSLACRDPGKVQGCRTWNMMQDVNLYCMLGGQSSDRSFDFILRNACSHYFHQCSKIAALL